MIAAATSVPTSEGADEFASLGDLIWYDADEDGVQDAEETGIANQTVVVGIPGVQVTLYDGNNQPISSTVTGVTGRYLFGGLVAGSYSIAIDPPAGYVASPAHRSYHSDTDIFDSDIEAISLRTLPVTLAAGERNMTLDAGLHLRRVEPASIGNGVWLDLDRNGQWDMNEVGVPGVDVRLLDQDGSALMSSKTNAQGFYHFSNLLPGTYQLEFAPPVGFSFTEAHLGDDEADSDANVQSGQTATVTLTSGTISQTVFAGLTVSQTVAAILGIAWHDTDLDGLQESGEGGVPGVLIQLLDANGNYFAETLTANDGIYQFPNLLPLTYSLSFQATGYEFTKADIGSEGNGGGSNIDPISGISEQIIFGDGEFVTSINAGLAARTITRTAESNTASLGDSVWEDIDLDGVRDSDEPAFADTLVRLLNPQGELIAGVRSNANGLYRFDNLLAGEYFVEFVLPKPNLPEAGARFVTTLQGNDPMSDSDSNPDPETARTSSVSLRAGETNLTVDAGAYLLIPVLNPTAIPDEVEPGGKWVYLPTVMK